MGATILPDRPIPLAAAREWTHYGKNLESTPLVAGCRGTHTLIPRPA
jgi:hypothetical protein